MNRGNVYLLLLVLLAAYFVYTIYPFYQRYWASCIDQVGGGCKPGKRYVENLEKIAYGLTFDDAETLANELRKPANMRQNPRLLDFKQYLPDVVGLNREITI